MKQFNGNQLGERYTIETEYYLAEIKIKNKRENVVNFIFFPRPISGGPQVRELREVWVGKKMK